MTKSLFQPMFKRAQDKAFTKKNIELVFYKSSIQLTNSSYIIKTITCLTIILLEKQAGLRSLKSIKVIRRFYTMYN